MYSHTAAQTTTVSELPAGLDQSALLASARTLFLRLQRAWDHNQQGDLFELTTPEMFAVIKRDLEDRGSQPSYTEITQLDVELLSTEHSGSEMVVSLRFHGHMREEEGAQTAQPFAEVWNIVGHWQGDPAWRLAGIQQIGR